jgi:hypothetical protein
MKTAVEMLQALRYKLQWFCILIDGLLNFFGDSSQKPEAT